MFNAPLFICSPFNCTFRVGRPAGSLSEIATAFIAIIEAPLLLGGGPVRRVPPLLFLGLADFFFRRAALRKPSPRICDGTELIPARIVSNNCAMRRSDRPPANLQNLLVLNHHRKRVFLLPCI